MAHNTYDDTNMLTLNLQKSADSEERERTGNKTYRVIAKIPRKCRNNYTKYGFIVSSTLAVIFVIIIIVEAVKLSSKEFIKQTNGYLHEPMHTHPKGNDLVFSNLQNTSINSSSIAYNSTVTLLLIGKKGYATFDLKHRNKSDFIEFVNDGGVYVPYGENNFFWYTLKSKEIYYKLVAKIISDNQTHQGVLFDDPRVRPQDMAYDHIGENLYVIDKSTGSLIVIDVKSKDYDILLTGLTNPYRLELDPRSGFFFILQQYHSILRGDMDGKNVEKVIESDFLSLMTLDLKTQKIYWINEVNGIESSNYSGKNVKRFPADGTNIHDLTVVDDQLFWLWQERFDDESIHHLVTCQIKDDICENHSMHSIHALGNFASIRLIHSEPEHDLAIAKACRVNNGDCQQICMFVPNERRSCTCKLGWQLNPDQKTCRKVDEFMLYTFGNFFRGHILDTAKIVSINVILPTPYTSYEVKPEGGISFEYDKKNDILYFTDTRNIYKMKLNSGWNTQSIILEGENSTHIRDIAFDQITENLYYLQNKPNKTGYTIKVMNVKFKSVYSKLLINITTGGMKIDEDDLEDNTNSSVALSLVINPATGNLYYYVVNALKDVQIHKITANGTEILQILDKYELMYPVKTLAFDYTDKRVYWIHDAYYHGIHELKYTDINGENITSVSVTHPDTFRSIAVNRKFMYISTSYSIFRVNKLDGNAQVQIVPLTDEESKRPIFGIKIVNDIKLRFEKEEVHSCNNKTNVLQMD